MPDMRCCGSRSTSDAGGDPLVEVPVTIRLDDLHFVLQIAIGWQNCHPFEFRSGETAWACRRDTPDASPLAADTATLADLLARGRAFKYDYVYGEDWAHTVEIRRRAVRARYDVPAPRQRARPLPTRGYRRSQGLRDLFAGHCRP